MLPQTSTSSEIAYADDADFISENTFVNIDQIEPIMAKYNLLLNKDKTEKTEIIRMEDKTKETWRKTKKVGSLIGEDEDIKRRKSLPTAAMNKLNNIWKSKKIKRHTKLKTYKTLVKSVLLYNSGTWGMTKGEEEKVDAFHQKQLKRI